MQPWWQRCPERLEYELQALRDAGISVDRQGHTPAGCIMLHLTAMLDGKPLPLVAVFPDFYPYTRFEVYAPGLVLEHHQNPFGKNLCLIGQETANWHTDDNLAAFIVERLPLAVQAARSHDPIKVAALEEHQGEPATAYYLYQPDTLVLVDSAWSIDRTMSSGSILLGYWPASLPLLRGAVLEVRGAGNQVLATADEALGRLYPKKVQGRWVRLPKAPRADQPADLLVLAGGVDERAGKPPWQRVDGAQLAVTAIVFPEEVAWRQLADGWLFVVQVMEVRP